jgi:hypothetical protein
MMAKWGAALRGIMADVMRAQGVSGMVIAVSRDRDSPLAVFRRNYPDFDLAAL